MSAPPRRDRPAAVQEITMVAAVAENGIIGRDGGLPWHIPSDLAHFKRLTVGHTVIAGRRTFEEVGKPLPDRRNIIVTSRALEGVETARSLAEAIARSSGVVAIIGGRRLYEEGMDFADVIHLTRVHAAPDGDTLFPPIDPGRFALAERGASQKGPRDEHAFHYETYVRLTGAG